MLKFLNMSNFIDKLNPVTTPDIFAIRNEFHSDGLFSERIFGSLDTDDRRKNFSYIELHTTLIHPTALKIIIQLNRKINLLISATETFNFDSKNRLVLDPEGFTGLSKFIEIFPDINFRGETETREKYIKLLKKSYGDGSLFINYIPVIPPAFRDAYQDQDGNWIIDKLNDIYQSLIRKSIQVKSSGSSGVLFDLLSYGLQLAVLEHDKFIKSKIEKKNGLIRNQMLGKRIDFSGRAVIIPGVGLKINEVGLPFRIAVSLFEPFIIHYLLYSGEININELSEEIKNYINMELSIDSVRRILKGIRSGDELPKKLRDIFWNTTEIVMKNKVVICKRDPVLQPESVRGLHPVLVDGDSLKICTTQVGGYNADFDGDQMAVYTPLTNESQQEIKDKMMNLTSASTSDGLIFSLNKEMYVGIYTMTKDISYKKSPISVSQNDLDTATDPYIPVIYNKKITTMGRAIFNNILPKDYPFIDKLVDKKVINKIISDITNKYDKKVVIDIMAKLTDTAFKFATIIAPNISLDDLEVPDKIYKLKEKLKVADTETANNIMNEMTEIIEKNMRGTGLHDLILSGSGKGFTQPIQILGAKGITSNPNGEILDPIKSSFAEGLTTTEFFKISPSARKGLGDRVLNTATTGYFSRKLSYVLNDVELDLYLRDCGTKRTIKIKLTKKLIKKLTGRYIVINNKVEKFNPDDFNIGDVINLRSPIYCISKKICHTCYGDLLKRHKTKNAGILSAQLIGQSSTQLIMQSFHVGGVIKIKQKNLINDIESNIV